MNMICRITRDVRTAVYRTLCLAAVFAVPLALGVCPAAAAEPRMFVPATSISAAELAVIVNDRDPLSVKIARYYQKRRGIPAANIIHLAFAPERNVMSAETFAGIAAELQRVVPASVQAYALTWLRPFRVACMSITAAFALGYDPAYCAVGCRMTKTSPYFDADSTAPYRDFVMRPTMSLAATDLAHAKALIDRGLAADGSMPAGTGYLVETQDKARNVRAPSYPVIERWLGNGFAFRDFAAPSIRDRDDVMFYFIGAREVPDIDTNRFLPGAIADHLTSSGGVLSGSAQMNSLRWLEAGATGSFGTVVEPCNYPAKFPNPWVVIRRYLQGESLIEAYWKSVQMPGQGIFIGEPLARPFAGYAVSRVGDETIVRTRSLRPGRYALLAAALPVEPYRVLKWIVVTNVGIQEIRIPRSDLPILALVAAKAMTPQGVRLGKYTIGLQDTHGRYVLPRDGLD